MNQQQIGYIRANSEFISKHLQHDTAKLSLKYGHDPQKKLLIAQIAARQRIQKKLPEWYANPEIVFPPTLNLEQASSQATAKLKASLISGENLLDITGGMGVDTAYLSRSFGHTTYVEMDPQLYRIAQNNFEILGIPISTRCGDGPEILKNSDCDTVYADPHRRNDAKQKVVALSDCLPDVTRHTENLTFNDRTAIIKTSPMLDIQQAMEELKSVKEIWVISLRNECKEVVYVLNHKADGNPQVKTFNITPQLTETFDFQWKDKSHTVMPISAPLHYLYEANASIMKSGAQDLVATDFNLEKLHSHSHFYTSESLLPQFPGKVFEIVEILKPYDKKLKKARLNVISRNFPDKASEIEKRLKLKSSKNEYLIATLAGSDYVFILCRLFEALQ